MCVCVCAEGLTTTTAPELVRPELWITLSFLLLLMAASVCGIILFLRFRRTHCKLKNVEDRDVTMLKAPNGDDPTYGVRVAFKVKDKK